MIKKSNLILSTIAVISLSNVAARISKCSFENGNCTGTYSEDVNVAFVDCFDEAGTFMSREEDFYTSPLVKECNSTDFGSFSASLNGTSALNQLNLTNSKSIHYCDYFELSEGYKFTQIDVSNSIWFLEDRVGGPRDTFFKAVASNSSDIFWDWNTLAELVEEFQAPQCNFNSSSSNSSSSNSSEGQSNSTSTPVIQGGQVWNQLPLAWDGWNSTSQDQQNVTAWSKAQLQFWLKAYINYYDIFALYLITENATMNATDGTGVVLPQLNSTANSSSAGSNDSLTVVTSTGIVVEFLSFSDFWSAAYDKDSISVDAIIQDINSTTSIYEECVAWFEAFFGPSGFVTLNYTLAANPVVVVPVPTVESDIPSGLEDIVAWIKAQFEIELRRRCPQCFYTTEVNQTVNNTNSSIPATNSTPAVNSTDNSTSEDNSTLPSIPIDDNSTLPAGSGSGAPGSAPGTPEDNSTGSGNETIPVDNSTQNGTDDNSTVITPPPIVISPPPVVNSTDNSTENNSTLPVPGENGTSDNETLPSFPEGGYGNTTDNSTGSAAPTNSQFNAATYQLPTNCAYQDTAKTVIKCSSGIMRSVSYTIDNANNFWVEDLSNACADAQLKFNSCKTNTVITNSSTCFYLSYYNAFQLHGDVKFYGFLYFDSSALSSAFDVCSKSSGFTLSLAQFRSGFQFPFGNISL